MAEHEKDKEKEKKDWKIFKRIYTGQFRVHRGSLILYLGSAALLYMMCMIYMVIFVGNAMNKGQPENLYTGTIHYFLGVALVLFGMCSKGMWLAVSRQLPEKRQMALSFLLVLNLGFWAMYFAGIYIDKIWALLGRG